MQPDFSATQTVWRRGRDSNPQYRFYYRAKRPCFRPYHDFTVGMSKLEKRIKSGVRIKWSRFCGGSKGDSLAILGRKTLSRAASALRMVSGLTAR